MIRYFARVEYDGSLFYGWGIQPDRVTIQAELEDKIAHLIGVPVTIMCGGRTDAGVHARGQSFHFDLPREIVPFKFQNGLNALLPDAIAVFDLKKVESDFHARFSATKREYLYTIVTKKSPLLASQSIHVTYTLDWKRIEREVAQLLGEHEFTSFCSSGYYSKNHFCNIECAEISYPEDGVVTLRLRADRFIYNMVRTIVGTLIDMGRGRIKRSMSEVILAKDRLAAGYTAPARGLTFEWVYYEDLP